MRESDMGTGEVVELPDVSQYEDVEVSENEEYEDVTGNDDVPVVDYEDLLREIDAISDSQVDYTQLLQEIRTEQLIIDQHLTESIEYQKQMVESMKLVNTFIYIFFIFLVGFIGYKIFSWLI